MSPVSRDWKPNAATRLKPVIGLVGAIGAGKSTVAAALATRGGIVIDADQLGHEAIEQPEIRRKVLDRWGNRGNLQKPDGRLDRRAIAGIVFADPAERQALEALVFPYITERALERIRQAQADPAIRFAVVDAAVMLEAGWEKTCDRLIYVEAPREARLARLAGRSGWNSHDLEAREAAQWPAEKKRKLAQAVIVNDGDRDKVQDQVERLLKQWQLL